MNSKKSFDYDELVDLESLLPIYVIPIIMKARTVSYLIKFILGSRRRQSSRCHRGIINIYYNNRSL